MTIRSGCLLVGGWTLFLLINAPCWAFSDVARSVRRAPSHSRNPAPHRSFVRDLRAKLAQKISLEGAIDGMSFQEALDELSKKSGVPFWIDTGSFRSDQMIDSVCDQHVAMPKLPVISLESALSLLLRQVRGGFRIRDGYIEVTTLRQLGVWDLGDTPPPLPFVHVSADNQPLADALTDVADASGMSIVLDRAHVGSKARKRVTATLQHVQGDTAVSVLADLAGLAIVRDGNTIVVTSVRRGRLLEAKENRRTRLELQRQMIHYPQVFGFTGTTTGTGPLVPIIVRSED